MFKSDLDRSGEWFWCWICGEWEYISDGYKKGRVTEMDLGNSSSAESQVYKWCIKKRENFGGGS